MLQRPCLLLTIVSAITLYFVVRQRRSHASCCRLCMRFAFNQDLRVSPSSQGNFKSFKWDFSFKILFCIWAFSSFKISIAHQVFCCCLFFFFQKESLTSTSPWWSSIYFLLMTCEMNIRKLLLLFRCFVS